MKLDKAIKLVLGSRGKSAEREFGRTSLMKHLYFLKTVGHVQIHAEFELYHWGPFSSPVLQELDRLIESGDIRQDTKGDDKGYDLYLNQSESDEITDSAYEDVRIRLAKKKPRELEALSTLHMVKGMLPNEEDDQIIEIVKNMKPHLELSSLRRCLDDLKQWGWL